MLVTVRFRSVIILMLVISIVAAMWVYVIAGGDDSSIELPIIMYHGVLKDKSRSGKYVITPDELEDDLKFIRDNGYTAICIRDLINYVNNGAPLPDKPIMLTFDDGYYNNYVYAFPLIKQYSMKMVLSVIGIHTEKYSAIKDENPSYAHVTWDNICEMDKSGVVEIQNHSYNMHTLSGKRNGTKKIRGESNEHYKEALTGDLTRLQDELFSKTQKYPTAFTYPFGSVSNASFEIIRDMGFSASLSCAQGVAQINRNAESLYMMKRFIRPHGKPISEILEDM